MSRPLFVGAVHGCAFELKQLIDAVVPTELVLVGDLFTKGPDPAGVWRLVLEHDGRAVLGNQDQRLLRALEDPARVKPGLARCIDALNEVDRTWCAWLERRPLFLEVADFTVVHAGLHPSGDLARTTREMALNMRGFPLSDPEAPRWHEQYTGDRRVAFGHDARRGLVRHIRDGKTWLMGLDSGCVYGKALSGYVVEEDRVIQIPAAATYQPV